MKLTFRLKGGPTSGNHGHAGRPGKVGGSAPAKGNGKTKVDVKTLFDLKVGGFLRMLNPDYGYSGEPKYVSAKITKVEPYDTGYFVSYKLQSGQKDIVGMFPGNDLSEFAIGEPWVQKPKTLKLEEPEKIVSSGPLKEERQSLDEIKFRVLGDTQTDMRGYFISGDDRLIDITDEFGGGSNDHPGAFLAMDRPEIFGMSQSLAKRFAKAYEDASSNTAMQKGWDAIFNSGAIRVRQFGDTVYVESKNVDKATLRRLQRMHDINKFNVPKTIVWSSADWTGPRVEASAADFLSAKYVVGDELKEKSTNA